MEDDKGAAGSSARASSTTAAPAARPPPPPPPNPPKEAPPPSASASQRQRFTVELRPGETTIVSWKKLLKESDKSTGPSTVTAGADPGIPSGAGPSTAVQPTESEPKDAVPPPHRFSAVIEKIERLYVGKQSSDEEELDDVPDDDQYDTEDSFIDDAELDEYFQVDKLATKHIGYFVNKGKLERIESGSSPNRASKKRRRKESTNICGEKDHEHFSTEPINMSNMRIKAAARSASLAGKKLSSHAKILTPFGEHYEDGKHLKNKLIAPTGTYKKKTPDYTISSENPSSVKILHKDASSLLLESKDFDKRRAGGLSSKDLARNSRGASESFDGMYQASRIKGVSPQVESQPKKLSNDENEIEVSTKVRYKEKNDVGKLPDLNSSEDVYPMQTAQPSAMRAKEGSAVRPKGTALERAIRDLEKIVAGSRWPNLDIQEVYSSSQVIKRRLPQDIKQKLAKVARLSASQGKVSEDELMDRLMGILGHLVQRKSLKRQMKEMVELGLSAKQQKADRFQQIKKEVREMIRTHVSLVRSKVAEKQDCSADDFQQVISNDERRSLKGKYSMDKALEDKICDLYDLYVEGMDEDKGPQSRKLYVQLAELWPNGYMDNLRIKDAIYRSKERKRAMYRRHKVHDEERIKRKRLASSVRVEETSIGVQIRTGQERSATDSTGQALVSPDKLASYQPPTLSGRPANPAPPLSDSGRHHGSKHYEKVRGGSNSSASTVVEDGNKALAADAKKKRKPETYIEEFHGLQPKLPAQQVKERNKSHKKSDEPNVASHPLSSIQLPALPSSNQPS